MDTFSAFAMGEAHRHRPLMVFDWEKAARLIKDRGARNASAGLMGDWEWTGGEILREGKPLNRDETYTFLASTWATPELEIDGEYIDCYRMEDQTPGWDSGTFWPESALAILDAA